MSGRPARSLIGRRFGRLEVRSLGEMRGRRYWLCLCDCGTWRQVPDTSLIGGRTQSCGCLRREHARAHIARVHAKLRGRRRAAAEPRP